VGAFWTDAANLFETARQADGYGSPDCDWAILIGANGGIRMLQATGWTLPALLAQHGAEAAYRVTRESGHVRLEGLNRSETCVLGSESPAAAARRLLGGAAPAATWRPGVPMLPAPAHPAPCPEGTWKMFA